jgi:hypothetical protein
MAVASSFAPIHPRNNLHIGQYNAAPSEERRADLEAMDSRYTELLAAVRR